MLDALSRRAFGCCYGPEGVGRVFRELSVTEQRYQVVLAVVEDGVTVTAAAVKAGVSRQTVDGWLGRYAAGGLGGLADRSPSSRR